MHAWHDVPWGSDVRESFNAIVEIPEGSKVKYELDKATGLLRADRVLLSVGRIPNTDQLGLESVGIRMDARGRIEVDKHFATSAPGFYAIGDVIAGPMLAHKAEEEGVACVEHLVNGYGHVNYDTIPGVAYTHPEIATVGESEDALLTRGIPYDVGRSSYRINPRGQIIGDTDGFVKILFSPDDQMVLGVSIIGEGACELIHLAASVMSFKGTLDYFIQGVFNYPAFSDAFKYAAYDGLQALARRRAKVGGVPTTGDQRAVRI